MLFYAGNLIFDVDLINLACLYKTDYSGESPRIICKYKNSTKIDKWGFNTKEGRDNLFDQISKKIKENEQSYQKKGKFNLMQTLKDYFNKHQDTIITLGAIWLIDYYFFDGKFQDKIKNMVDKLLGNVEKKLMNDPDIQTSKGPLK